MKMGDDIEMERERERSKDRSDEIGVKKIMSLSLRVFVGAS